MTSEYLPRALALFVSTMALAACNDGGGADNRPINEFNNFDGGTQGCIQASFPADQPDISPISPPRFVTVDGEEQRLARPGQELLAEITVNGATKKVFVELREAWLPEYLLLAQELDTPGNQTIPLSFFPGPNTLGRFYMRLTLCGFDCAEREVVFDISEPDQENQFETGINAGYERTVIEKGDVVTVDSTCVDPNSVAIQ